MKFYKYHGTGNDFICIDNKSNNIEITSPEVVKLCDRNFGIGADGVILMTPSENGGDIFMDYWNSDGSFAEMCGNGVRVTARFAKERWGIEKPEILIDTRDGIKLVRVFPNHQYQVNMGAPVFQHTDFPSESYSFKDITWDFASMGNPHMVGFFENEKSQQEYLEKYAKILESKTDLFPNKINVSSVWKKPDSVFGVQTFERGCGFTLACGTAASACFAWINKWFPETNGKKIQIDISGGTLFFEYSDTGEILMTGPAKFVFEGTI